MELYSQSSFSHFIIFVAGIVNVTGVLSVQTLTTNITGHFAYFAEEIMKRDYAAMQSLLYSLSSFLFGAFTSNFLAELISRKHPNLSHVIPIALEMIVLVLGRITIIIV
jgi:uncharacterized membrane protein YoaK (UPF0700 family)